MRQVDACDFCGDAPDGVFEVVPAAVPDGPVRLALCADCQRTLETVVEPLLDARDADDNGSEDARTGDSTAAAAEPASGSATARDSRDERPAAASSDARDASDAPEAGDDTTATEREDGDAGGDGDDTDSDDDDDDGVTIEASSSEPPAERPDGYAQVLRLLENRDGGMPRSDLRSLATNAYDLTDASFEAAVEAAVENGDVEDTSGDLRRT